jgi:hypothetical protein
VNAAAALPLPPELEPVLGQRMHCAGFASRLRPSVLRGATRHFLTVRGVAPDLVEDTVLVLTELLSNTQRHLPHPGRAWIHVYLYLLHRGDVRIEVYDPSPRPPRPRKLAFGENGRGLMIVSELSADWGFVRLYPLGKFVYAELSAAARAAATPCSAPPPAATAATTAPVVGGVRDVEAEQRGGADDDEAAERREDDPR